MYKVPSWFDARRDDVRFGSVRSGTAMKQYPQSISCECAIRHTCTLIKLNKMERTLDQSQPGKTLAVFCSKGAFGDCARLSILAAMDDERVNKIKVYSAGGGI